MKRDKEREKTLEEASRAAQTRWIRVEKKPQKKITVGVVGVKDGGRSDGRGGGGPRGGGISIRARSCTAERGDGIFNAFNSRSPADHKARNTCKQSQTSAEIVQQNQ